MSSRAHFFIATSEVDVDSSESGMVGARRDEATSPESSCSGEGRIAIDRYVNVIFIVKTELRYSFGSARAGLAIVRV